MGGKSQGRRIREPVERFESETRLSRAAARLGTSPLNPSGLDFIKLCKAVAVRMGAGRRRHVLGVARLAEKLAVHHGCSPRKARIAGILHDVARSWNQKQLLDYAKSRGLRITPDAVAAPVLLHAAIGADIAQREFGVDDPEVLGAITRHTVAVPGMSALEKIVYLADTCEPSRTYEGRASLEALAFASLDDAMLAAVAASLQYLAQRRTPIAEETLTLYNDLVRRHGGS